MLTQEQLKQKLSYNPHTGDFVWIVRVCGKGGFINPGTKAGFIRDDGYVSIAINGVKFMAQSLAWLYMTGEYPSLVVDHKDRNRSNNIFSNLRLATWVENCQNKNIRSDNKSGVTGVSFDSARKRWAARIRVGAKYLLLGRHIEKQDAINARLEAEIKYFGEFSPNA